MRRLDLRQFFAPNALRLMGFGLFFLLFLAIIWGGMPASAASTTIVISEVLYDPAGTEPDLEWIELYNLSASSITLTSYKVGDEETSGGGEGMYQFPSAATINPAQVIIIANKATAFATAHGFNPTYELIASDATVPDMIKYNSWASGSVSLANTNDEVLILDGSNNLVDALSWGGSTFAFNPSAPDVAETHSLERNPATTDTDTANDWIDQPTPNPGSVSGGSPTPTPTSSFTPTPTPVTCGKNGTYRAIWEVQGSGDTSPYANQTVSDLRGIVTADFQNGTGGPEAPRGFFIQAHETDCNSSSSDGLFIYTGSTAKTITVGSLIEIDNTAIKEYQGPATFIWELTMTEAECFTSCAITVLQPNYGVPVAQEYDPPADETAAHSYKEALESMLVRVTTAGTVIAPANQYNELMFLRGLNLDRPHQEAPPHGNLIVIDGDGIAAAQCGQNGLPYIKTFDTINYNPGSGYAVYGPLNYNFNTYKVQQDDNSYCIGYTAGDDSSYDPLDNPPPAANANVFTIGSMNAWNFFDTTDDPNKSDEIESSTSYNLKSLKLAAAICDSYGLNRPLVVALQEVENDIVLQKLVADIQTTCATTYSYHTLAGPDDRSIQTAYLLRTDQVSLVAMNDRQGCSAVDLGIEYETGDHLPDITCSGGTPYYLFDRPPLQLELQVTLAGSARYLYIFNNHFKSKLSSPNCVEPDCTDVRIMQAQFVDSLVDGIRAGNPNAYIIVMGDLNDYYNSLPLDYLDKTFGVLNNSWSDLQGPPGSGQGSITRYSYIHDGVSQTLDHILLSDSLYSLAHLLSPRHVNTDYPGSHISDNTMYRTSDHDLLALGITFTSLPTPTPTPTATPPVSSTGYRSPTAHGANTGGDGNGYQTNPTNAYTNDGLFATDTNSGTAVSTSCTSAYKDKHRFASYGFTIPVGVAINGIEVRLDAKVDSTAASPKICVQLSWNGGTSWTTAKSTTTLTTAEATYILGSPTDSWGHTWNNTEFSNASFRVRVINVASSVQRDFSLDWIAVNVYYQ